MTKWPGSRPWRISALAAICGALAGIPEAHAQGLRESFLDDPVAAQWFVQKTTGTESRFSFDPGGQNLTAILDVDVSAAYYLSIPFPELRESGDASFSARLRVDAFEDHEHPAAFVGLMTDQHVGDFGDGLVLVLSVAGGTLVGHAVIESFDQSYSGSGIPLPLQAEFLAVGRYRAGIRQFAVEIFTGPGFTNLHGFSTTTLPPGQSLTLNRLGLQNAGARDRDASAGSITLTVDDLFAPASNLRTINIADSSVTEGDLGSTNATFQVQLSLPSSLPITVDYATGGGTATPGTDYLPQSGTLTFAPGVTTATLAVPVLGDLLYEGNETFGAQLTNAVDATIGRAAAMATILDNDARPFLTISDVVVLEGDTGSTNASFVVSLSSQSGQPVTVQFATANGSALQGADYTTQSGAVTFAPGETAKAVVVPVLGDVLVEGDESFVVVLSNPVNAGLAKAQGAGTIFDDDSERRLSINDVSASEGNAGQTPLAFTVSLTRPHSTAVSADYAVASGTARVGEDLLAASGRLTIPAGVLSTTLTVMLIGDTVPELDETFTVNLSNPANATIAKAIGAGTIRNDDPFPDLIIEDAVVTEGDASTQTLVFPIQLSAPVPGTVTVNYSTGEGTATAGSDFLPQSGTLTFPPGTTTQSISVPVPGDLLDEANETVFIDLAAPTLATLWTARATGTILDNDSPPTLVINDPVVTEGHSRRTDALFTLRLSAVSGRSVSVSFRTADETASAGRDYVARFGTVTFPPGSTTQTVAVAVIGDTLFEPDESFQLRLENPDNATLTATDGVCTIQDDDPAPGITVNDVVVTETADGSEAVFALNLAPASTEATATVRYATSNGSALAGSDYEAREGVITFAPGVTQASVAVPVLDDTLFEADETFFFNLTLPTNASLGTSQATATIQDNEAAPTLTLREAQVLEGDSGPTDLVFTVELDRPAGQAVTATFTARDGTAAAAAGDYVAGSGEVRVPAGAKSGTFVVRVNGDVLPEFDETVLVELSQVMNAIPGTVRAQGTILDDDTRKLSVTDVSVNEGHIGSTTNAVFTIVLNKASTDTISVQFSTVDDTATAAVDYLPAAGTVVFAPGVTAQEVAVRIIGDNDFELSETFFLRLSAPVNALLADGEGVGTILDDELAVVITPSGLTVDTEECTPSNGAIDPGETVTVRLGLVNIGTLPSATVVARLLPSPGITPINAAQTYGVLPSQGAPVSRTFTFKADGDCGQTLTAVLELQNGGTNFDTATYSFTLGRIVDGQPVCCQSADLVVTVSDQPDPIGVNRELSYLVQVSNRGPRTATSIALTNSWRSPIRYVSGTTTQGTCTNRGEVVVCELGSLNPGGVAEARIVIAPQNPGPLIGVFHGRSAEHDPVAANNTATTVTMVSAPTGLSIGSVRVIEGDSGSANAAFGVHLSPPSVSEVRVDFATADGTAKAGEDYLAVQGTVVLRPGTTSTNIFVPVVGDTVIEPDETFTVTLRAPSGAPLAAELTTGTGTIVDNDLPQLGVSDAGAVEPAAGGRANAVFTFWLSAAQDRFVTVDYTTRDGLARAPDDYTAAAGRVTFAPGTTTTTLEVPVQPDTLSEPDETFFLLLSNPAGARLDRDQATALISDNNPASLPRITLSGVSVVEGRARTTTNAVFQLRLSRASSQPVQVDYSTANGTATGGSDFVISSGQARFAPGETSATIAIPVNGDDLPEPTEAFSVRLSNPVNAAIDTPQAEGVITTDEYLPHLVASGARLVLENCQPPNASIDPLETVTVEFGLVNRGLAPTANLTAELRARAPIVPLSNRQTYGAIPTNAPAVYRSFTFSIDGLCGQTYTTELELRDGGVVVGTLPFEFTLGALSNGQYSCCTSADLAVSVLAQPNPATAWSPLAYFITVANQGPSVATGILLTNRLNVPAEFISSTALDCVLSSNQVVCALPDLLPGGSMVVTNIVRPTELGSLINIALVSAVESDAVPKNNVAIAAVNVVPPIGLSIADLAELEGNSDRAVQFTVRLHPPRAETVTVAYGTADGTAGAGLDYVAAQGVLTLPPGTSSTNLAVMLKGDLLDEPDETFLVTLSNPVNAPIGRAQGTGKIVDDDQPALSINDVAVNVGTNAAAVARLTVSLSSGSAQEVRVTYATSNGSAVAGTDYEGQQLGTVIFPPGSLTQFINVPVAGNTADEGEEQFFVRLSNPAGATLADDLAVVVITDDDPVDLSISDATVTEGHTGQTEARFTVTLRQALEQPVTVDYFTSDGTARAGSDYLQATGTLQFPPGTLQAQIPVAVLGDRLAEGNETFFVTLTNALNGVLRNARATGTILDDETVPCLSLADATIVEGDAGTTSATMAVRLSGPSSQPITVEVVLQSCGASGLPANSRLIALTFTPGQTEAAVPVPVLGDRVHEPNENCAVTLANAAGATICRGQALLTVIDNDPLPGLEIDDASVTEGNSDTKTAVFHVSLTGASTEVVTVRFATQDATAVQGTDYTASSGVLTFTPGMTATNLPIAILGDVLVEPDETFSVVLSQPTNATVFRAQGVGTILNDDSAPQADCPSLLAVATVGEQTCFEPFAPIVLSAAVDEAADKIRSVEFYSGSTLLGIDSSSPFQIVWEGVPVGDYCITAQATCSSGAIVRSEPFCIGVTDSGAAIAIIRNFPDPEIDDMREILLEMGYCARVFDQEGLTADQLLTYRLVIWNDLGAPGLRDTTVTALGQVFDSGIPVYMIGDRLVSAGTALAPATRTIWTNLLKLNPLNRSAAPGTIHFSEAVEDRQPGSILSGRFSEIADFAYLNSVDLGQAAADASPLASAAGADLFLQFPRSDVPDFGEPRIVTQTFRVRSGGDEVSLEGRRALFQNAICWLLRCSYCPFVHLLLDHSEVPESINVGEEFTMDLTLGNNGECVAFATIVTNRIPAGLALVNVTFNQGINTEYRPEDRTLIWRVGSVVSGFENNAILSLTFRALQPGTFEFSACAVANYERFNESNCTGFELQIEGTAPLQPPSLALLQTAPGLYQLRVTGQAGGNYAIQASSDLVSWLQITNAAGPLFYINVPNPSASATRARFYRAR